MSQIYLSAIICQYTYSNGVVRTTCITVVVDGVMLSAEDKTTLSTDETAADADQRIPLWLGKILF